MTVYYEFTKLQSDASPVINQLTPISRRGCTTFFKSESFEFNNLPPTLGDIYTQYATTAKMHGKPMLVSMSCLPMNWSGKVCNVCNLHGPNDITITNNWLIPFPSKPSRSRETIGARKARGTSHQQSTSTSQPPANPYSRLNEPPQKF